MQWLLHGDSTPAAMHRVAEALRGRGDTVHQLAELELPADASPMDLLKRAARRQWDLMTTSAALVDELYRSHAAFNRSVVLLEVGDGELERDDAIERLFGRYKRLTPGRLYIVTPKRVKVRQLPTKDS